MKKFLRKLFHFGGNQNTVRNEESVKDSYLKKGLIQVGKNSNISKLTIENESGFEEITHPIIIGDNCTVMGVIALHSKDSRIKLGNNVFIGPGSAIFCRDKITIGSNVMISWGCTIIDTNAHSLKSNERVKDVEDWARGPRNKNWENVITKEIKINNNCWVGFNSIITKGVELGEGVVVGCGSVVTKGFNEYSIIGGNPAEFIKKTE
jgi:acetyltransferase-like isoleucine patch superfamily enzyme